MSEKDVLNVFDNSRYILDVPPASQTGVTVRCFEALARGIKLITTDQHIVEYDIYSPDNVYIFRGNFDWDDPFFHTPFKPIDPVILERYSVKAFAKRLLGEET